MKKITVNKTRILTAAAALVAVFSLAGCGSNAVQEIPRSAETSRSEEATPETAAPEATATPTPTPEPTPAVVVPTSVTLEQEGGILNNGMTWTLHATVLPEDAADKTLTWTSADESVATIDDSGVITTHAPGQTTITAASTAGGVSTTYNLVVQEVVKCSYCGGTGHTSDTCAVKKTAEQQAAAVVAQQQAAAQAAEQTGAAQAAEQPAAEAAQPADPGYAVTAKGDRIYPEGSPDIPEGGVVQRPDGTFYVKCLFETTSAIATVGLSLGLTPHLGIVSQGILIFLMFIGRVGGLTMIYAALSGSKSSAARLPQERITVG